MSMDRLERERELQLDIHHNEALEQYTDDAAIEDGEKQDQLDALSHYLVQIVGLKFEESSACVSIVSANYDKRQAVLGTGVDSGTIYVGDYAFYKNEYDQWIAENMMKQAAPSMYSSPFEAIHTTMKLVKQGAL